MGQCADRGKRHDEDQSQRLRTPWNAALETGGVLVGDEIKITIEVEAIRQQ